VKNLLPNPSRRDVTEACQGVVRAHLARIEAGEVRLRIPRPLDQMQVVPGMHFHLTPELLLQVTGRSTMTCPQDAVTFRPGEICIIPRGVPHVERMAGRGGGIHNLVIAFHTQSISFQVNELEPDGRRCMRALERFESSHVRRISEYLDDAVSAQFDRSRTRRTTLQGAMLTHLSALLNLLEGEGPGRRNESFKVTQCRYLVSQYLTDATLSVQRLAEWIQCAPDYLSHLFHAEVGETLALYINRQRVNHAKRLLETSSLNISQIARASGYSDPGYFARVFRRLEGETPRECRRRFACSL